MTGQGSQRADTSPRLLRRRTTDRVMGGVGGGLGDYFNVDPLLFRIGFVGLMIFGGAGLVLYLIGWILIPAEGNDHSMLERFLHRLLLTPRRIGLLTLAGFVILLFVYGESRGYVGIGDGPLGIPGAMWALGIMVAGVYLLRRTDPMATDASAPTVPAAARQSVVRARRPRSPLAWYVIGTMLLTVGVLAIVTQVASVQVSPGQFFGAALAVMGLGLLIGAWWGRARILILLAILILPMAITASFVTAPLEGGTGDVRFAPSSAAELRDEYRLMAGRMVLDLSDLTLPSRRVEVAASVTVGQLLVILRPNTSVEVHSRVGAGTVTVFDASDSGTSLDSLVIRHHRFGPTYVLDLRSGIGEIEVITQASGSN